MKIWNDGYMMREYNILLEYVLVRDMRMIINIKYKYVEW